MYQALADLLMLAHFTFLLTLTFGGFLAWRWPRFIVVHVALAIWGVLNAVVKVPCPLTSMEDLARRRAGEEGLPRGFVDQYLTGVIYPEEHVVTFQLCVAALIAVSWVGLAFRRRARRAATNRPVQRSAR